MAYPMSALGAAFVLEDLDGNKENEPPDTIDSLQHKLICSRLQRRTVAIISEITTHLLQRCIFFPTTTASASSPNFFVRIWKIGLPAFKSPLDPGLSSIFLSPDALYWILNGGYSSEEATESPLFSLAPKLSNKILGNKEENFGFAYIITQPILGGSEAGYSRPQVESYLVPSKKPDQVLPSFQYHRSIFNPCFIFSGNNHASGQSSSVHLFRGCWNLP